MLVTYLNLYNPNNLDSQSTEALLNMSLYLAPLLSIFLLIFLTFLLGAYVSFYKSNDLSKIIDNKKNEFSYKFSTERISIYIDPTLIGVSTFTGRCL